MSNRPTSAQRNAVSKRASNLCEYCKSQEKYSNAAFEVEHIIPISKGGETVLENLAFACAGCNKFKSDQTSGFEADTQIQVNFYNPRLDVWNEHFIWNENLTEIVGLTAQGRVTINALKLNRKNLVNLRNVLIAVNEHPPDLENR